MNLNKTPEAWIGPKQGRIEYSSSDKAKLAIFDALEKMRQRKRTKDRPFLLGEQHLREDLGFIPTFADWVKVHPP